MLWAKTCHPNLIYLFQKVSFQNFRCEKSDTVEKRPYATMQQCSFKDWMISKINRVQANHAQLQRMYILLLIDLKLDWRYQFSTIEKYQPRNLPSISQYLSRSLFHKFFILLTVFYIMCLTMTFWWLVSLSWSCLKVLEYNLECFQYIKSWLQ